MKQRDSGLFKVSDAPASSGPVECLGRKFASDEERREYYLGLLREKLKDPEFRKIEGFPIGKDEDILALSDPPYYTACPNPFIEDFIRVHGKPYDPKTDKYHREPFATDVSVGKTGAIYNAHSYHTKVPPKAIQEYILHFTGKGDMLLDGFCGTGMTGVAALLSDAGRASVLVDLSPAAGFIAAYYTSTVKPRELQSFAEEILDKVESETRHLYETSEPRTGRVGVVESVIWSAVLTCPSCNRQVLFWRLKEKQDGLVCPECGAVSSRDSYDYFVESYADPVSGRVRKRNKKLPVEIVYKIETKRLRKIPDDADLRKFNDASVLPGTPWFPTMPMLGIGAKWGDTYRAGYHRGYEYAYDFYFPRTLVVLAKLRAEAMAAPISLRTHMLALLTSVAFAATHLYKYRTTGGGQPAGNNLYVPALVKEQNTISALRRKLRDLVAAEGEKKHWQRAAIVSTSSATELRGLPDCSIDYIFVDPPFGANIMYSESSFLWEAWLGVRTHQTEEAIVNDTQHKGLPEYQALMTRCFQEHLRVLKPGRWMTVEFHNSQNSVWTSIQEALGHAGFIVADVRTLDKKQGTFKQVTTAGAVKQDLIISAYRPNGGLEQRFHLSAGTEEALWDFVRTHLRQLPVFVEQGGLADVVAERLNYLLFDRMVAFHVQRGVTIPLSATEFYEGLGRRFPVREGMYFLPEQAAEYDKKRMKVSELRQLEIFVVDEASAIQWLRQELQAKPQSFQDLQPRFMREVGGWEKHEASVELREMLGQGFLCYDGDGDVPSQIYSYLSGEHKEIRRLARDNPTLRKMAKDRWYVPDPNKARDIEKLREKALLKEFEDYKAFPLRRMKVFRLEAVRAGFRHAWQERDYATIINVARKIPEDVLQEDPKLLMWYDQAVIRSGKGS